VKEENTIDFGSIKKDHLTETFSFDDPDSIIQSDILTTEKKIQLRILKKKKEDEIKKSKKKKEEQPKVIPKHLIPAFLILYLPTQSLAFAASVGSMLFGIRYAAYKFDNNLKGDFAKTIKALEKDIKKIEAYIKIIEESELI
jgi:hypothetical protein